jgi:hypothetical protein
VLPDGLGWITKAAGMLAAVAERIGSEQFTRNNLREGLKPGFSEMLSVIDDLSRAIYKTTKRQVVCFVDGADRSSRKTQLELFHMSGHNLAAPNISLVYTIELSLRYMNEFKQIEQLFVDYGLPNLRYTEPTTAKIMEEMLTRRVRPDRFAEDSLEMLVKYSGGVPRTLIQLANSACLNPLGENCQALASIQDFPGCS